MYLLTIVILLSQVVITSSYSSKEECERVAAQLRLQKSGTQAVESAECEGVTPGGTHAVRERRPPAAKPANIKA